MSLLYGGGNPRWFYDLAREDQVRVIALRRLQTPPKKGGGFRWVG